MNTEEARNYAREVFNGLALDEAITQILATQSEKEWAWYGVKQFLDVEVRAHERRVEQEHTKVPRKADKADRDTWFASIRDAVGKALVLEPSPYEEGYLVIDREASLSNLRTTAADLDHFSREEARRQVEKRVSDDEKSRKRRAAVKAAFETYENSIRLTVTKELLAQSFALPDGTRVLWGAATVEQHQTRLEALEAHAIGTLDTAALHRDAIRQIKSARVKTLGEVGPSPHEECDHNPPCNVERLHY